MNPQKLIPAMEEEVMNSHGLTFEEAMTLMTIPEESLMDLLASARRITERFKGKRVSLCAVINAKSGLCPEDCAFCSQSAQHKTSIKVYPLLPKESIIQGAQEALTMKAHKYGLVISGKGIPSSRELEALCDAFKSLKNTFPHLGRCASLGFLTHEIASALKEAGLQMYHHNVETSQAFFPKICSTHSFKEKLETIELAKEMGFKVCSGGIFGLGEGARDRVEMAFTLKELDVDSVPLNFLIPIPGTKLGSLRPLMPMEALRIIAAFRFILPEKDIRVCGGREAILRDLQAMALIGGANGIMVGNYLTTQGRNYLEDLKMIEDLHLKVSAHEDL